MRNILPLCLSLLLLPPSALAAPEPVTFALDAVTYQVDWTYYDGFVAQIGLRETPNDEDVALVWALAYDPDPDLLDHEMNSAATLAERVVGSYCDVQFAAGTPPEEVLLSGGVTNGFDGRGLSGDAFCLLPEGLSPDALEARVTVGVRTRAEEIYDEWDTFALPVPRNAVPVVDLDTRYLDLGATDVARVLVSRTPNTLVVCVSHVPSEAAKSSPFAVTATVYAEQLRERISEVITPPHDTLVHSLSTFWLEADAPLPSSLRLSYRDGKSQDLLLDLAAGTVSLVPR